MSTYHYYKEINIFEDNLSSCTMQDAFLEGKISDLYAQGFKFTRKGIGIMQSTRLLRVNLSNFELSSENRRILRKFESLQIKLIELPYQEYDYKLGKWMKDFYQTKFGEKLFDISVIKNLFEGKLNFNSLLVYELDDEIVGYCLCYKSEQLIHYAYPFYDLDLVNSSLGIAMMTKAIHFAKELELNYLYLGGHTSEKDNYKLQFKGLEWWDEDKKFWNGSLEELKNNLLLNN